MFPARPSPRERRPHSLSNASTSSMRHTCRRGIRADEAHGPTRHTGRQGTRAVLHLEAHSQRDPYPEGARGGRHPSSTGAQGPVPGGRTPARQEHRDPVTRGRAQSVRRAVSGCRKGATPVVRGAPATSSTFGAALSAAAPVVRGAPAVPQVKARPEGKPVPWDGCADHCGSNAAFSQGIPSPWAGAGVVRA